MRSVFTSLVSAFEIKTNITALFTGETHAAGEMKKLKYSELVFQILI